MQMWRHIKNKTTVDKTKKKKKILGGGWGRVIYNYMRGKLHILHTRFIGSSFDRT